MGNRDLIKEFYQLYCRAGMFDEAHLLLVFLRNRVITLGLTDSASRIEHLLENVGFKPHYGRNYNTAQFYL